MRWFAIMKKLGMPEMLPFPGANNYTFTAKRISQNKGLCSSRIYLYYIFYYFCNPLECKLNTRHAFATSVANASEVKESFGVHGRLTEWLGSGLQNRLRRFESATDLNKILPAKRWRIIF